MIILLKINCDKIDKARLFKGDKGTYLDAVLHVNETPDQYGNCGMITQSVSQEERKSGVKGAILGNGKIIAGEGKPRPKQSSEPKHISEDLNSLPF